MRRVQNRNRPKKVPTCNGKLLRSEDRCYVICKSTGQRCLNRASKDFRERPMQTLAAVAQMTNLAVNQKGCCRLCSHHLSIVKRKLEATARKVERKGWETLLQKAKDMVPCENYQQFREHEEQLQMAEDITNTVESFESIKDAALDFVAGDFRPEFENLLANLSALNLK